CWWSFRKSEGQSSYPRERYNTTFKPDAHDSGCRRNPNGKVRREHRENQPVTRVQQSLASCVLAILAAAAVYGANDLRLVNAAKNRDVTAAQTLLKQRVDVNAPDVDGMTPLHWAAHWDELELAKQLLAAGANAKAANRYGVTALHEATLVADVPLM